MIFLYTMNIKGGYKIRFKVTFNPRPFVATHSFPTRNIVHATPALCCLWCSGMTFLNTIFLKAKLSIAIRLTKQNSYIGLCFLPVFGMCYGIYDWVVNSRRFGDHSGNRVHVRRQHVSVPGGEAGEVVGDKYKETYHRQTWRQFIHKNIKRRTVDNEGSKTETC